MKTKSGQSIIEVVIAAALISMGVIAALSLTNYSQKQSTFSKTLNLATSYNNQASEWLRNQRTTLGWAVFLDKITREGSTYCLATLPADFSALVPGSCSGTDVILGTLYRRQLDFDTAQSAQGILSATITTTWQEKTTRTTSLTLEISQWK